MLFIQTAYVFTLSWITVLAYTKYPTVVNRLNYGLAFNQGPKLDIVSGRWLHLYRIVLPQFPKRMRFSTSGLCPVKSYINGSDTQGSPEEAFNKCLHQLVIGASIPETCYDEDNSVLKTVDHSPTLPCTA